MHFTKTITGETHSSSVRNFIFPNNPREVNISNHDRDGGVARLARPGELEIIKFLPAEQSFVR